MTSTTAPPSRRRQAARRTLRVATIMALGLPVAAGCGSDETSSTSIPDTTGVDPSEGVLGTAGTVVAGALIVGFSTIDQGDGTCLGAYELGGDWASLSGVRFMAGETVVASADAAQAGQFAYPSDIRLDEMEVLRGGVPVASAVPDPAGC